MTVKEDEPTGMKEAPCQHVKLAGQRPGLPGKEISFILCPSPPARRAYGASSGQEDS